MAVSLAATQPVRAEVPPPPNTPEGTLSFGENLLENGDSFRAATEFLRFLHHYPDHSDAARAMEGLGRAYSLAGRHEEASAVFQHLLSAEPPQRQPRARWLLGASLYQGQHYREASSLLLSEPSEQPEWQQSYTVLGTLAALRAELEPLPQRANRDITDPYRELPRKSPAVAGTLSAALPGAGHFYCGRPRDGTVSFVLNAVFLWGTVASVQREQWALAGILGFFELGWYSGNIVSSINAAHKWNRREEGKFLRQWEDSALPNWQLSFGAHGVETTLAWDW